MGACVCVCAVRFLLLNEIQLDRNSKQLVQIISVCFPIFSAQWLSKHEFLLRLLISLKILTAYVKSGFKVICEKISLHNKNTKKY